MAQLTYQQLEDLWVQAGGQANMAALMAAIALAESSGDSGSLNATDNNGTQSSFGLWQISTGSHTPPSSNWSDPLTNARLAVQKLKDQGLSAWGTYTTGAYERYLDTSVMPSGNPITQITGLDGVSAQNSTGTPFVPDNQPFLSLDALQQQDPLVAALVEEVPELKKIFQQAVAGQWSTDKFVSAIQNTNWWATHSATARQLIATVKTDPATWKQTVTNLDGQLKNFAAQLGAQITPKQLQAIAIDALFNGYDTNQDRLRQKFESYVTPVSGNHFGGEAGSTENELRQAEMNLGVFMPEKNLGANIAKITAGVSDVNSVEAWLRSQAAAMYPAYKNQINQGMNVSDIADPYVQQAQSLLEQGPGDINIMNPLIKQALQYKVGGQPTAMPLTDFENLVRQQPQWLQTRNAQDDMMGTAHKVLQDFGFMY